MSTIYGEEWLKHDDKKVSIEGVEYKIEANLQSVIFPTKGWKVYANAHYYSEKENCDYYIDLLNLDSEIANKIAKKINLYA